MGVTKKNLKNKLLRLKTKRHTKRHNYAKLRGGTINPDTDINIKVITDNMGVPIKDFDMNSLFDYFDIDADKREYLTNAMHDAVGLYSLLNWSNIKGTATYNNSNVIKPANHSNMNANNKEKDFFTIGKLVQPHNLNIKDRPIPDYYYNGTFIKTITEQGTKIKFKCEIFRNTDNGNILVLFKWGFRYDLTTDNCKTAIDNMYKFIKNRIEAEYSNTNILLFGFSMGGNIAQHIALRIMNDDSDIGRRMKDNVYVISFGIGGTMTESSIDEFNSKLNSRFISIAFAEDIETKKNKNANSIIIKSKYIPNYINSYILSDENNTTIKTIIINLNTEYDKVKFIPMYVKGRFYDGQSLNSLRFDKDNKSHLHDFSRYKKCIDMLVNNEVKSII